jgi:hypothetical protein
MCPALRIRANTVPLVKGDYVDIVLWSCIEVNAGIVCACLPLTRPVLRRMFSLPISSIGSRPTATSSQHRITYPQRAACDGVGPEESNAFVPLVEVQSLPRSAYSTV